VFTFYQETWADALNREMYMAGDRLLATLMAEPSVGRFSSPIHTGRRRFGGREG
jgi:hypothetical protein